jgi:hypothetical protein
MYLNRPCPPHQLTLFYQLFLGFPPHYAMLRPHSPAPAGVLPGAHSMAEFRSKSVIYLMRPDTPGAPLTFSGGLPAQESRDIELIVIWGYVYVRGAAVDVEALRGAPLGVFRDRIGAA